MKNNKEKYTPLLAALICYVIVCGFVLFAPIITTGMNPEYATFTLSFEDTPDEYGQSLYAVTVFENSTGAWERVYEEFGTTFEWEPNVCAELHVFTTLNDTLVGCASTAEGQLYLQHAVDVTLYNGTSVFSQSNFTYYDGVDAGLYYYEYTVILEFLPQMGAVYTITISYQIYY